MPHRCLAWGHAILTTMGRVIPYIFISILQDEEKYLVPGPKTVSDRVGIWTLSVLFQRQCSPFFFLAMPWGLLDLSFRPGVDLRPQQWKSRECQPLRTARNPPQTQYSWLLLSSFSPHKHMENWDQKGRDFLKLHNDAGTRSPSKSSPVSSSSSSLPPCTSASPKPFLLCVFIVGLCLVVWVTQKTVPSLDLIGPILEENTASSFKAMQGSVGLRAWVEGISRG